MVVVKDIKSDEETNAMDASDIEQKTGSDAPETEGEEDEVYVVECIVSHRVEENGEISYQIKWEGYPDSENTWEDEENIIDKDILKKYWDSVNSKKQTRTKQSGANGKANQPPVNKRRRTADMVTSDNEDDADVKTVENPNSKMKNWEDQIKEIMTVDKSTDGSLVVFVKWKDETTSEHPIELAYAKCPQTMLKFYEERLRFREK